MGLFACEKVEPKVDPSAGRAVQVSTAAQSVYEAMIAADGSKDGSKYFTLTFAGSLAASGKQYDISIKGAFDITDVNREDDKRTQLAFEIKQGEEALFLLYYNEGKLYLDFPPYARMACLSDFNMAQAVYAFINEKEGGAIKGISSTIPAMLMEISDGCRQYSQGATTRYVFTLSYEQILASFTSIVQTWDAGFTPAELTAALGLTEEKWDGLLQDTAAGTLEFFVTDGVFTSAKLNVGETSPVTVDTFSLVRGLEELMLPTALSAYREYDFRNVSLSGTLYLSTERTNSLRSVNYGLGVQRDFEEVFYPFEYDFKSHYLPGGGYECSLSLTDKNGKASLFTICDGYLYADLSAYGIQKFKMSTEALSDKLKAAEFDDVGAYDFKDALRLLTILSAARSEEGDIVTYRLGSDFFSILSEKIGLKGIFGVSEATIGWSTANDRWQSLSASVTVGDMTASLAAASFGFGSPVTVTRPDDLSAYYDLDERGNTRISMEGTFSENTSFSSGVTFLSSLLSSLSGEAISFDVDDDADMNYIADIVYGGTGRLDRLYARFGVSGTEVVTVYYTSDTDDCFYLIYPEQREVRPVRVLSIQDAPFASFNAALGASVRGVGENILLTARETSFTIGVESPMLSFLEERIGKVYSDFSLSRLSDLDFASFSLKITDSLLTAKLRFDEQNDLTLSVETSKFRVAFGEDFSVSLSANNLPALVSVLENNSMPVVARATFTGNRVYENVSLKDYRTGAKLWRYAGVPDHVGTSEGAETSVTATVSILGATLTAALRVDISPVTFVDHPNSAEYSGKYDPNTRTFRFSLYNEADPQTVLSTFEALKITTTKGSYVKDVKWDLSGVNTTTSIREFTIYPKTKTFFGNEIDLGSLASFTLVIEGAKAKSTSYTRTFVAFDGMDPADPAAYPKAIYVTLEDDSLLLIEGVRWSLSAIDTLLGDLAYVGTPLYAYSNDAEPVLVKAVVSDLKGNPTLLDVGVFFEPRTVQKATFDVSALDGVEYDAETQTFLFDVLKVREFVSTRTDKILPATCVANEGTTNQFTITKMKWEFTSVPELLNAAGASGELKLVVGDAISGFQTLTYSYAFTKLDVTKTELLSEDEQLIASSTDPDSLYSYKIEGLSVYTYAHPKKVRLTYRTETGTATLIHEMKWSYATPFREEDLLDGGRCVMTGALGSETMTVELGFVQQLITGYRFSQSGGDTSVLVNGEDVALSDAFGHSALTYYVFSALAEGDGFGLDYTDPASYPATLWVAFNGGSTYIEVPVTWDLSCYQTKDSIIRTGYKDEIAVYAKGQRIPDVYVCVKAAVDDSITVYVNEEMTEQKVTFYLITKAESGDGYTVVDSRKAENYPQKLYISNGSAGKIPLDVIEWEDLEVITTMYNEQMFAKVPANEVAGERQVKAKIGNESIGYYSKVITVAVVKSEIREIKVSGIPYAANSEMMGGATLNAITPQYDEENNIKVLEINPYYADPCDAKSYPAYLTFKLNEEDVRAQASWDLSRIPSDAATDESRTEYLVYAMISLEGFSNILTPVTVKVLKRNVDKVWIKDRSGEYSSQPYIDIDSYAADPFGKVVSGDIVTMDVLVQFEGDANRYPLKLKYSKAGVKLNYDRGIYENITVSVGNENGGYQEKEGYTIRVISNIVTRIRLDADDKLPDTDGIFFDSVENDGYVTYSYYRVVDMSKPWPEKLWITFGKGAEREVYLAGSDGAKGAGVVFEWVRNSSKHVGIRLWNQSVEEEARGREQSIYNKNQTDFNLPRVDLFFESSTLEGMEYRESFTVQDAIAHYETDISDEVVAKDCQRYFITRDEDDALELPGATPLNAGDYRLYVEVNGDKYYAGKTYATFTVARKDVTSLVQLEVDGYVRLDGYAVTYTGEAFAVAASVKGYPSVYLLVNGALGEEVRDVRYNEAGEVIAYTFSVTVNAAESPNYVVVDKELTFTINETTFPDAENNVQVLVSWNGSGFDASVYVFKTQPVYPKADDLTNYFEIGYYERKDDMNEVTNFTPDSYYYYTAIIKVPNYGRAIIKGRCRARW